MAPKIQRIGWGGQQVSARAGGPASRGSERRLKQVLQPGVAYGSPLNDHNLTVHNSARFDYPHAETTLPVGNCAGSKDSSGPRPTPPAFLSDRSLPLPSASCFGEWNTAHAGCR